MPGMRLAFCTGMNNPFRAALGLGSMLILCACQDDCGRGTLSENIERTVGDTPDGPGLMGGPATPLRDAAAGDAETADDAGPGGSPR